MKTLTESRTDRWPSELDEVFGRSFVCEYASLTRAGRPVTWPVSPYVGEARTLDVSTGLSYPDKAERARRNPRVALSFTDPTSSGLDSPSAVLVQGRAAVRDADLQANTDRYVERSLDRVEGMDGLPWFVLRRMGWYFARIWVEVTPERILWWPEGDLATEPREWRAGDEVPLPVSDPAPRARRLVSRTTPPVDWRPFADRAEHLGAPVVTLVVHGSPAPVRARKVERTEEGFRLVLPTGVAPVEGPVCLTFHRFGGRMKWQENVNLVGHGQPDGAVLDVTIDRALNDWSLTGSRLQRMRKFTGPSKELRKRLEHESARRGQGVPIVNRPA